MRAMERALRCPGSVPVRILSVTGTSTARTTASTIAATSGSVARSAQPDAAVQSLFGEKRRARGRVADLLGRTPHVDVDDLRAPLDVVARGVRHPARIGAGDLH